MIGASVTSIGYQCFLICTSLSTITVDALNSFYSSVDGVLFNKSQTALLLCPEGKAGAYTVPNGVRTIESRALSSCTRLASVTIANSVTNIGSYAFQNCTSLTNATIGTSVTSIGSYAFFGCSSLSSVTIPSSVTTLGSYCFDSCISLKKVYFTGNAPSADSTVLYNENATSYYLPGTTGWGPTFGGRPTALWLPLILNNGFNFGVQTNRFGFIISWAMNLSVVVEACTNLTNPIWFPVGTNTLTGGSSYFSDAQWTNRPACFYRVRSP